MSIGGVRPSPLDPDLQDALVLQPPGDTTDHAHGAALGVEGALQAQAGGTSSPSPARSGALSKL